MPFRINSTSVEIPKWLFPLIIGLLLAGWAAWGTVSFQARAALPRDVAAQTYMTKVEGRESEARLDKRLDQVQAEQIRIIDKLDKLLAR